MKNSLVWLFFLLLPFVQSAISQTVSIPALQTVNYKHHIRGGLLGINLDNSNKPVPNYSEGDLFSYKLDYETVGMYNGNVGKQTWARTSVLLEPCKIDTNSYTFTYDPAQRLTAATYIGQGDFSLPLISYDKNSNITGLKRNGWLNGGHGLIDNLNYTYSGNQLTKVSDAISGNHAVDLEPKLNGARTYYEDGSLKSDENKAITLIEYDPYLMLPTRIELTNNRWINMGYTMDGELEVREYSSGETWVYASGMTFLNGQPYSMPIPEGRAMYTAGSWKNEFFITDHLGNVRVTFAEENGQLKPKDFADYDPTGIEMQGNYLSSGTYKFDPTKFQDKESLSSKFGLSGLNDFGPRMLDKTLGGIFSQPDILGELNESASPFSYLNGRLLNMIDPTGMIADSTGGSGRLPGAPESSAQKEATPMNASQWPMYGASSSKSNDNYFPQTGFNTYPKGATNAQISKSIKSIDPQMALDVVGMTEIPILSQIAEFISAGISFAKRDYLGGSIGLGSMLPIAGKTFEAMKIGRKISKIGRKLWTLSDEGASLIKRHSEFGKMFKSKSDGLWWSVDNAGHGGSKFKVFKESNKGLEWFKDADEYGSFITNKHKGSTGLSIPWGQLKTIK